MESLARRNPRGSDRYFCGSSSIKNGERRKIAFALEVLLTLFHVQFNKNAALDYNKAFKRKLTTHQSLCLGVEIYL